MDATVSRIVDEVASEHGVDAGFLIRVLDAETEVAHLVRRHGILQKIQDLARQAARREIEAGEG